MSLLSALKTHFAESKIEKAIKAVEAAPKFKTLEAKLPVVEQKLAELFAEDWPTIKSSAEVLFRLFEHELGA